VGQGEDSLVMAFALVVGLADGGGSAV